MDRIEHFLSHTKYTDTLFIYSKQGIILNQGPNMSYLKYQIDK